MQIAVCACDTCLNARKRRLGEKRSRLMARILWHKVGSPTPYVSQALGVEEWQLRRAIHAIKRRCGLTGADRVIIYDDGKVTDEQGEELGNILDED